jgi:hypothetical protein
MIWLSLVCFAAALGVWLWSDWRDHRSRRESIWPGAVRAVAANIVAALLAGWGIMFLILSMTT